MPTPCLREREIGAIVMAVLADRVERKLLILASTLVWLAGMILVGTLANEAVLIGGSFLASLALGLYLAGEHWVRCCCPPWSHLSRSSSASRASG